MGGGLSGAGIDAQAIGAWCLRETALWRARRPDLAASLEQFREWNGKSASRFLFEIADRKVSLVPKTVAPADARLAHDLRSRAERYRQFLAAVLDAHALPVSATLVVDVGDAVRPSGTAPIFTFQKVAGDRTILLPDIDSLAYDFYGAADLSDPIAYGDKSTSAVFTGSTTGARITMETVRSLSLPRLRAARHFSGSPDVAFDLPNVVQCDSPETAAALKALGLPSRRRSWAEQFRHKFLISMDGNGATCSRVAIALKSNGVLLKYDSPHVLHYFSELIPWRHYIPIAGDAEVEEIVAAERRSPGLFRAVAEEGRAFYERHMRRESAFAYTAALLSVYADMFA